MDKTLVGLLVFFLVVGLFARRYDAKTKLLLITVIIGVVLYMTTR